jgi:integrase/recombinase XerD
MANADGALRRVIRSYLDHLTVDRGLAVNTLSSYRRDLDRYLTTLAAAGVGDLAAIGPTEIAGYVATLRAGDAEHRPLSAASTARAASAVRGLHRYAMRCFLPPGHPARAAPPAMLPKRLPRALSVDQVERLLAAAAPGDDARGLRDRALLEFLYATGARISEAVGCAVDDLDFDTGTVALRGQGGKVRRVPIGGRAGGALEAYLVGGRPLLVGVDRGVASVFRNVRGGVLSRQSAWVILRRAAERAGLPIDGDRGISPHTLRHSFATHLLDRGVDVHVVQELLGHASVATTQMYTLMTMDQVRGAREVRELHEAREVHECADATATRRAGRPSGPSGVVQSGNGRPACPVSSTAPARALSRALSSGGA